MTPRFISLEGGEGAGKSTQARALAAALGQRGIDCLVTREPGGSEGAEAIRALLLQGGAERWSARAEALLFAAARADHVERTIRPALAAGRWVICDRFVDSSLAYQGAAGGLGTDVIRALHDIGSEGLLPDRTLVLMLGEEQAAQRCAARDGAAGDRAAGNGAAGDGAGADRIAARPADYHRQVEAAFRTIAAEEPHRVRLIDASGASDQVTGRLLAALGDLLR